MKTAYIVQALRTAGSKAKKGAFRNLRPDDLAAHALKGLTERAGIDPSTIDDIVLGCAFPEGEQGMNIARIAALRAGFPVGVPAVTVNRFCASGLESIYRAVLSVSSGGLEAVIAGGVESMTMIPMGGVAFSANPSLVGAFPESYAAMGITAELVAEKYGVTREAQDAFAVASHQKADAAMRAGKMAGEIIPVTVDHITVQGAKRVSETVTHDTDEGVRPDTTLETLAKLPAAFKQGGTVTAGNSSQMTDGAAALLVVSEDYLKAHSLKPVARMVSYAVRGVSPEIMGIGPVESIPKALAMAGLRLSDIGRIELNEAFAAQAIAVIQQAGLNPDIVNVNGGAIALGHPLGATGAKLTATLIAEMHREQVKYGMVTMCIGGGMGATGIFEVL